MTPTTDAFDDASSGSTAPTGTSETTSTQTFQVVGMACDHCARAVTSELMTALVTRVRVGAVWAPVCRRSVGGGRHPDRLTVTRGYGRSSRPMRLANRRQGRRS